MLTPTTDASKLPLVRDTTALPSGPCPDCASASSVEEGAGVSRAEMNVMPCTILSDG